MKTLTKLKELHAKTTQGELRIERRDYESGDFNFIVYGDVNDFAWCLEELDPKAKQNADFIAEAHKYLPRLIEALEKCMEQRDYFIEEFAVNPEQADYYIERDDKELEQILEEKKSEI